MKPIGARKRRYRNLHHRRDRKITPTAVIIICVAATLIISIVTGILLKAFLDEEAYDRLVGANDAQKVPTIEPVRTNLPNIKAPVYALGGDPNAVTTGAVSVALNTPDGTLQYTSPVSAQLSISDCKPHALVQEMQVLWARSIYVSGVFYPQAFSQTDTSLRYAVELQERALLAEFFQNGGKDVVLCGVDGTLAASYAKELKAELSYAAVGIALPLEQAQGALDGDLIPTLCKTYDFCALDLRSITPETEEEAYELIKSISYYLLGYDMRLLLSEDQTLLLAQLSAFSIPDYQIIAAGSEATEAE